VAVQWAEPFRGGCDPGITRERGIGIALPAARQSAPENITDVSYYAVQLPAHGSS